MQKKIRFYWVAQKRQMMMNQSNHHQGCRKQTKKLTKESIDICSYSINIFKKCFIEKNQS